MWASGAGYNAAATPPFVAAIEGGSPMAVCAAFPPNGGFATDAAVLGKYEQGWGSCNVAGFAGLAPGASSEFNARNFSVLVASPRLVWGAPPPAAAPPGATGPVTFPGASVNGAAVFACRAYHPTAVPPSGPHAGYFTLGGPCVFSFGGASTLSPSLLRAPICPSPAPKQHNAAG